MRNVVVATHGHCFDGLCSAVMFTRLMRHIHPGEELAFTYRAMGYEPGTNGVDPAVLTGQDNAILDYRFSAAPQLTWYFDHHVSAFPSKADRLAYDDRAKQGPPRTVFHDGGYGSCTKLIADIGRARFGLDSSAPDVAELIRWADMIDSAAFPSADMPVGRKEPELHLMTVVESFGDDAFLQKMVPRLLEEPLHELAMGKDIEDQYLPIAVQQDNYVELVKKNAVVKRGVVVVDLSAVTIDAAAKFVTYALWPDSAYSVSLTSSSSKCKISIGYNPWAPTERRHNIAAICERYGGGGHPVVGAIALAPDQQAKARTIMNEIAEELSA